MTFQFHDFELDTSSYQLRRDGQPLKLEKMPMDLLFLLVQRPGELVSRHDIQQGLWGDAVFVDAEPAINTVIRKVRQALQDDADKPRFIETVVGKGYRFIAPVVVVEGAGSEPNPEDIRSSRGDPQPRGRFARRGIAAAGLLLVLAAGIVLLITRGARMASEVPAVTAIRSIAVLPLDNLSGDPTQDAFAEAMTDELITNLAKVSSLKVISRGSTVQFKGTHKSLPEIGRALHVDALVEGSVVRSGQHVRVTAQLIDAATDRHLWAESYDRDLRDVLTLQKQVAGVIASAIRVTLTPGEQTQLATSQPTNPDAYLAYVKGRYYWNQRTEAALNSGIESFRAALAVDPSYAEAYAGIADCYTALGYGSYLPPKTAFENARASAQKAMALNPNIADAYASLAYVNLYYDWDFAGAEEEFRRAISLNPNSVIAHDWYSVYLTAMERFDDAQKEIARAQELDPLAAAINTDAGFVSYYRGHYDAAAKQLRATIEISPGFPLAHLWLGRTYQEQERYEDANREYAAAAVVVGDWPVTMAAIGNVEGVSGNRPAAEQVLNRLLALSRHKYVTPYGLGLVYAAIGDDGRAFAALRQAVADRSNWLVWLKLDPRWGKLRRDPRFGELLQQIHLVQ
jgi:TolB-like protein/DNA-binding winged helix-turn-helix (wHTH) protein/TolA-binding protein